MNRLPQLNQYNLKKKKKIEKSHVKDATDFLFDFLSMSSIHGFPHITTRKRHPSEFCVWFAAIAFAVTGATLLSLSTWKRFQENPTVVSMERNYKDWNTSFAGVTICPIVHYDEKLIQDFIDINNLQEQQFIMSLANATYKTFDDLTEPPKSSKSKLNNYLDPTKFLDLVYNIKFKFLYNVSNSYSEVYDVLTMVQTMTESGICYTYNSIVSLYFDPTYWSVNNWTINKSQKFFEGSPLDGDIFAQVMNMKTGYMLYVHAPTEVADTSTRGSFAGKDSYKTMDLQALSTYSTEAVRKLSVKQRKCRFLTESNLLTSPVYTYNLCRMECRMKEANKICGCVPFFYRPTKNYKICDYDGMKCLASYGEILIKLMDDNENKLECVCYPPCEEVNYKLDSENSLDWTLGTNVKWGLIKYPRMRLKRDILFGWSDLLVGIGGTAGLFLGCSLLSFAEIFYFLTLRLFWFVYKRNVTVPSN